MSLTEDRWRRAVELFTAAVELPRDQQNHFLDRELTDDADLRSHVARMLAHAPSAAERITRTIESVAQTATLAGDWIGRRFGPYRVVREIGRGGMGMVFEAVRDDDQYRKTVALKVAPWWRDVEVLRERFRSERQILAELEHPHIARFLDGGDQDGIPYFAMEYVEGIPITEFCRTHGLSLRERIELFQQVCAAVHYAHESLVVHRDLKPANILVARDGSGQAQVKLLDFGIAKLLSPLPGSGTASTGAMLWTPDYTSPEQVRHRAVTTRTDVYSLGLVLYEMLSGERGQAADNSSPLALDRSICEMEPPPVSERAGNRQLRGDLDTIVAMAIRKEPERRYGSAAELSEDLRRHLEGRPVRARPNTMSYRAGKFALRHRIGLAAGVLVIASLTAGGVSTIYQARRAERRFQQVRQLANAFVFDVHDRVANVPGTTEARRAIVQTALTYLENLRKEAGGDPGLLWELAGAYERVGDVQWRPIFSHLGDTQGALASYTRAEEILTILMRQGDPRADLQLGWIYLRLGQVRKTMGEAKASMGDYSQAREITRRLLKESPRDAKVLDLAIELHANMTTSLSGAGDTQSAAETAGEAMDFARRQLALDPGRRLYRSNVGAAHVSLAMVNIGAGQLEEAVANYRAAVEINEQLVREDASSAPDRTSLMLSYSELGDLLRNRLGDMAGAAVVYGKALEIAESLRRSDPTDRKAGFDLCRAQRRLGAVLFEDPRQAARALPLLEEASRVVTQLVAEDPKNFDYRLESIFLDRKMGEVLASLGRSQEAMRRVEAARSAVEEMRHGSYAGARSQWVQVNVQLAALYARAGDARALALANAAVTEMGQPPALAISPRAYGDVGRVYLRFERFPEAAAWLEKSAQRWRESKLPKAFEARRKSEVAALEADLAVCKTRSHQ
jgi:eukaryotic-like serine/threonine-protein kinase